MTNGTASASAAESNSSPSRISDYRISPLAINGASLSSVRNENCRFGHAMKNCDSNLILEKSELFSIAILKIVTALVKNEESEVNVSVLQCFLPP